MTFDIFNSSFDNDSYIYMFYKDDKKVSLVKFDILKNEIVRKLIVEEFINKDDYNNHRYLHFLIN